MKIHGTAQGGALSKKDFGVAFGTAAVVDFVCQEATGDNFGLGGGGGINTKVGVRVLDGNEAIGKAVTKIRFYMKIKNSPSGTVTLAIYNDGVDQSVSGSSFTAPADLTTSFQLITFTLSSHTIAEDDDIVIEGTSFDDANQVRLSENTNNTIGDQIAVKYTGSWSTDNRNVYWCYQ